MSSSKAPKMWALTKNGTASTFESWRGNLSYTITLDQNFAEFLNDDCVWKKKSESQNRGFTDLKTEDDPPTLIRSAAQRANFLDICLGMIALFSPIISRSSITRDACSMKEIFQKLRAHYGFALSGSSVIDIVSIKQSEDESPEDVFQRIQSQVDSCLLSTTDDLLHHGSKVSTDEFLSPTLENLVICLWLKTLHPLLPQLVKTRYSTQLKNCTIASICEEISSSIPELLNELNDRDQSSHPVFQTSSSYQQHSRSFPQRYNNPTNQYNRNSGTTTRSYNRFNNQNNFSRPGSQPRRPNQSCPVCKQAGRRDFNHFLSACPFLPEEDKRFLNRARQ